MVSYKSMNKIIITKIAAVAGGLAPIDADKYVAGTNQTFVENKSLPIEYTIEGELVTPIEIGKSLMVHRHKRNGVVSEGFFTTSIITSVSSDTFTTKNSVYRYMYV